MKFLYFFYLLKKTNFSTLHQQIKYVAQLKQWSYGKVLFQVIGAFAKYNTAFLDYFSFKFYEKSATEKSTYIHPVFLYRFQNVMNERKSRSYFKNKDLFLDKFSAFVDHKHFLPLNNDQDQFILWLKKTNPSFLILKNSTGYQGVGIEKVGVSLKGQAYFFNEMNLTEFYSFMNGKNLDLIEVSIEQHTILSMIYAGSLNTIRIITVVDQQHNVHIMGAMLRVGSKGFVDNFSAGGVGAKINLETGTVLAPLVSKDSRLHYENGKHPVTGKAIVGVTIPFWKETREMITNAARVVPSVRTVGWDVAITEKGPYLLEGNDNWNQVIWQRTSEKGHKAELEKFLV